MALSTLRTPKESMAADHTMSKGPQETTLESLSSSCHVEIPATTVADTIVGFIPRSPQLPVLSNKSDAMSQCLTGGHSAWILIKPCTVHTSTFRRAPPATGTTIFCHAQRAPVSPITTVSTNNVLDLSTKISKPFETDQHVQ